ncbi:hypothetical protein [Saliphagus sp. LR7]|uniref:hypothetical protein n=1 Tax=Saliphagus sp. LR7 TaxID=2282654 RepID=UPI000DF789B2|nr:hypothetical protein [Saliphagus sp. LR7]
MKRRAVLAAGAAAALAGCSGDGSDDADEGATQTDDTPDGGNSADDTAEDGNATTIGGDENETANETGNESPEATGNESDEPPEYELVVLVIDAEGEPIEGATVAVAENGEPIDAFEGADRATTDGSGAAEATLPEGSYQAGAIAGDRQTVEDVELSGDARVILRIEPTEAERAAEAIDRAQSELSAAVADLDDQSGDVLDATDELSTRPIADRLSAARLAVADAREFEATDDQEATLSAIESAVAFVRTLLEGQPWLHGIARSVDRLLEALGEGEDDRATYVAEDVARELESGAGRIGAIEEAAEAAEGDLDSVEAVDWSWVDERRSSLVADDRAAGEIAGTVEGLLSAEERFGESHEVFERGAYVTARSSFETSREAFEDVRAGFEPPESSAFAGAIAAIDCTAAAMARAADRYYWAADAARSGDGGREEEYVEAAEEALDEAGDCGLRPIGSNA